MSQNSNPRMIPSLRLYQLSHCAPWFYREWIIPVLLHDIYIARKAARHRGMKLEIFHQTYQEPNCLQGMSVEKWDLKQRFEAWNIPSNIPGTQLSTRNVSGKMGSETEVWSLKYSIKHTRNPTVYQECQWKNGIWNRGLKLEIFHQTYQEPNCLPGMSVEKWDLKQRFEAWNIPSNIPGTQLSTRNVNGKMGSKTEVWSLKYSIKHTRNPTVYQECQWKNGIWNHTIVSVFV